MSVRCHVDSGFMLVSSSYLFIFDELLRVLITLKLWIYMCVYIIYIYINTYKCVCLYIYMYNFCMYEECFLQAVAQVSVWGVHTNNEVLIMWSKLICILFLWYICVYIHYIYYILYILDIFMLYIHSILYYYIFIFISCPTLFHSIWNLIILELTVLAKIWAHWSTIDTDFRFKTTVIIHSHF